jgi:uncharacterized membrane protein
MIVPTNTLSRAAIRQLLAAAICAGAFERVEAGPIFVNLSQFGLNRDPMVSADGSTIVSTIPFGNGLSEAAIWKWGSQAQTLGVVSGRNSSVPTGVSANGGVVVGFSGNANPNAFRWSASGGMQTLQSPASIADNLGNVATLSTSFANGVSADGQTVVGGAGYSGNSPAGIAQAVVWNGAGVGQFLFHPQSQAYAISANGTTVAGEVTDSNSHISLFLASSTNSVPSAQLVPFFAAPPDFGITANGQMLFGTRVFNGPGQDGHSQATTWTQQAGLDGLPPGASGIVPQNSTALAASANGGIIGGSMGGTTGHDGAMVWDATHGFQSLHDLFVQQDGLSAASGWVLQTVTGMSADGLVITGTGAGPQVGPNLATLWVADLRNDLANGNFEIPALNGWSVAGTGTAAVITDPFDANNHVAKLIAGSPISIFQTLATPNGPFDLNFDYDFRTTSGKLDVYLGSTLVDVITAPGTITNGYTHESLLIDDLALLGLPNTTLTFELDGPHGSQILVDNVGIGRIASTQVPEPHSFALFAGGLFSLFAFGRAARTPSPARGTGRGRVAVRP